MRKAGQKLYWFAGRNTAVVASSLEAARNGGSAGSKGKLVASRSPDEKESRQIAKGEWVRSRAPGKAQNSSSGSFKYRPQLKNKSKGRSV